VTDFKTTNAGPDTRKIENYEEFKKNFDLLREDAAQFKNDEVAGRIKQLLAAFEDLDRYYERAENRVDQTSRFTDAVAASTSKRKQKRKQKHVNIRQLLGARSKRPRAILSNPWRH
tara:strand:- start:279 stop:626 length:348 start_codon:yes stop_codon:yes gene_type:complete